jgi:DNA-binding SARP family transcriptional activator
MEIRLFGTFDARIGSAPLPPLRTRKGTWLLVLLILRRGRAVSRDWLCATLWPDSLQEQARGGLRRALTDLRRALGPEARCLRAPTTDTLCFDLTGATVDVLRFDEAVSHARDGHDLETAAALYGGPLLEDCTEEWALTERAARQEAFLNCLSTLADHAAARGDHTAAASYLRRVIATDPLRETAQRNLMAALARSGDHAAALQTYHMLKDRLGRTWDTEPCPETTALYRALCSGEGSAAPPLPKRPIPGPMEKSVHFGAETLGAYGADFDAWFGAPNSRVPAVLCLLTRIAERLDQIYTVLAAEGRRMIDCLPTGAPAGDSE